MQKAMFFEEAFKKGVLPTIESGFILSISSPNFEDINRKSDPFLLEMISYSGVKSVIPIEGGVKFQAQGRKMYCMLEPSPYTEKHVEPTYRSNNTTGYMPFRFKDCTTFLTKDSRFTVLIPEIPHNCYDSFTVSFPGKGDMCILYFMFDKDLNGVVLPFIKDNVVTILKKSLDFREADASNIARQFIDVVKKHTITAETKEDGKF
ncbi:MAG: hypothetical protein A2Y34_18130 [Spirochaetes bacterium GWC1_27_15]|nr:MAG: hypothetical protein A2Y34_18130 [Spirochaetes bacterium GWC1_27_15]